MIWIPWYAVDERNSLAYPHKGLESPAWLARYLDAMQPAHDFVLLSLIKGKRLRNIVSASTDRLLGTQVDVEDLRKNYYCIASNCSQACEPDQPADDRQPMPSSL